MAPKPKVGKKRDQEQEPAWEYVAPLVPQQIVVIEENWVACDNCQKWRKLPKDYIVAEDSQWYCKLSPDLERNSCTSAEEAYPEDNPQPLLEVPMLVPQYLPQVKKEVKKQGSAGKPAKGKGNGQAGWNSGKGGADKWGARDEDDYDDDGKDEDDTEDDDYMDSDKEEAEPGAKAPPKKKRKPTDYEGGYGAPKQSWSDPMKAKQRQAERPHRPSPAAPTGVGRSSSMVAPTMSRSAAAAVAAAAAAAAAAPPPPEVVVAPAPKTFENVSEELQELETACKRLLEQGGCWTPPAPNQPASAPRVPASQSLDIPHWLWQGLHYFAQEASAVAVTAFESLSATEYAARENGQEVAGVSSGSMESGTGAGGTSAGVVMPSAESYARMALLVAAAQALPGVQAMAAAQPPPAAPAVAVEAPQAQRVGVGQAPAGPVIAAPQGATHAGAHHSASPAPVPVPTISIPTIAAYSTPAIAANLHPATYSAPAAQSAPIQPQTPTYPIPASHAAAYTAPAAASHTAYSLPSPATQVASYPTIVPNSQAANYSSAPASAAGLIGGGYPVLAPGTQAAMFNLPTQPNLLSPYSALAPSVQQIPTFPAPLTASQMAPLAVSTPLTQPYTAVGLQMPFSTAGTAAAFTGGQVPFYNPSAVGTVGVGQLGQLAGFLAGNTQMAPSLAGQTLNALAAARAALAPGGQGVGGFGALAPGMQAAVYPALANLVQAQQHQQSSVANQQHGTNTWQQQQGTAIAPLPPQKPALLSAPPPLRPAPLLRQQQQQQQLYPLPDQMQALLQQQQRQQLALQQQKLPQQMQGQQQQMNPQQYMQQQYMQQLYLQKAQQNRMNVANAAAASAMASATAFSQQQPGSASTAANSSGGAASTTASMPLHGGLPAGSMDMSGGVGGNNNKIPFVGLPPHLGMDFKSNMVQPVSPFPASIPAHLQAVLAQHQQQLQPSAWSAAGLVQPSSVGSNMANLSNNSSMQMGTMMQQATAGATGSTPAIPTSSDALFMQQLQILAAMPASTSAPMTMTAASVGGFLASMQQPAAPQQQPVDK